MKDAVQNHPLSSSRSIDWLPATGEMARLIRTTDWAKTAVGSIEQWPQSLRIAVRIMLTSRYAMWMGWGPELTFFCNDAYRPTLGVKHPWALGRSAREVWAEIWPDIGPRIEAVLTFGEATWDEALLLFLERSGYPEETYHTFSYSPLANDQGETVGMLCVVTEETERVIGERRLTLLRELASALASVNLQEDVFSSVAACLGADSRDLPFTLTYCFEPDGKSATLASMTGLPPGHSAAPRVLMLNQQGEAWPLEDIAAGAGMLQVTDLSERFGSLPTGPWPMPPREAVMVPVAQQGQERPAGVFIAGVNPYRKFDAEYIGFLKLLVGQITSGLANARAYEEERRRSEALAELDRAKTMFFSNVSHEFRTPLTLILGPIEDALHDPGSTMSAERLEMLHRNALRLQRLVNSLLDFSRVEAGRIQACYVPCDIPRLTAELASVFRSAIERAGLELVVECETPLPRPAFVDREMWEKIVLNLLSNALKYTFDGQIRIAVKATADEAILEVQDTGTGISELELSRLFERFHRIEGARGRTNEGSGIGLALVQELVKLHGGTVQVTSAIEQGSTFTIRIPLGRDHLPGDRVDAAAGLPSTATAASAYVEEALRWLPADSSSSSSVASGVDAAAFPVTGSIRPLIVLADDNTDMREYVRSLLSPTYDVVAVGDGLAALAEVRRCKPNLLLSDVMMPGLDGFGLVRELRAAPETTALPIILLSARAGEEARIEGLEHGADDYLVKPFTARDLVARVSAHLELSRLREAAGAALRESEERFRLMADNAPVMVWVTEPNGECTFLSKSWYEFTGQTPAEGLGLGWVNAVHPDDRELAGRAFLTANEKGAQFRVEYRLKRQDGEYRWALDAAIPRFTPDGQFQGYIGSVIDITDRKRAEQESQLETLRLQKLSQTALTINSCHSIASVAQVITKEAQSIIGAQQAITRLNLENEWAQDDTATNLSTEYVANPDYPVTPPSTVVDTTVLHTRQPVRLNREQIEKTQVGPCSPVRGWLAVPLIGRDGQNIGVIQLLDRREGEFTEADEAVLVQLAQMGAIAIENARLYEGLRLQDQRKDEFLAMLAHELRNPLAPIRNAVFILKEAHATASQRERVRALIERQVETLARLVDDLMDVSRVTRGKIRLSKAPTLLSEVVRQAVETSQPIIDAQGHHLEIELPNEPLIVHGDLTRLGQVLANVLSNAAKYTSFGGTIRVQVLREGEYGILRVRDNGTGIAPEVLPHIFDLFTQAERSLDRSQGGLGIGLALTKKLVELHGGTITAHSEGEGLGSEFSVSLPLYLPDSDASSRSGAVVESEGPQRRVLVVEDNRDSAEMLVMLLELGGHQVAVAYDGVTAVDRVAAFRPDVVLLDIGLPGKSGYEAAREIRANPQTAPTLLVAMTGYGQVEDKQRAVENGFDRHLTKPVDPEELQRVVVESPRR